MKICSKYDFKKYLKTVPKGNGYLPRLLAKVWMWHKINFWVATSSILVLDVLSINK